MTFESVNYTHFGIALVLGFVIGFLAGFALDRWTR